MFAIGNPEGLLVRGCFNTKPMYLSTVPRSVSFIERLDARGRVR